MWCCDIPLWIFVSSVSAVIIIAAAVIMCFIYCNKYGTQKEEIKSRERQKYVALLVDKGLKKITITEFKRKKVTEITVGFANAGNKENVQSSTQSNNQKRVASKSGEKRSYYVEIQALKDEE